MSVSGLLGNQTQRTAIGKLPLCSLDLNSIFFYFTDMNFTKTDEPCTCECHKGQKLYHFVLRPCCEKPMDGGRELAVFELEHDGEVVPVIGLTQQDAEKNLKRFLES